MAVVIKNIVEGASVREQGGIVLESIDVAIVHGLSGGTGWSAEALATAGLPTANESHPNYSTLTLRERRVIPLSPSIAQVELVYRVDESLLPTAITTRGGSRINSVTTAVDRFGKEIQTTRSTDFTIKGVFFTTVVDTQTHEVTATEAQRTLSVTDARSSADPSVFTAVYVNKINSKDFQNGEPGTWFCSGITFAISNRDASPPLWKFVYNFQHKQDGWQPIATHQNKRTGEPADPLIEVEVDWYESIDFNNLGLFAP